MYLCIYVCIFVPFCLCFFFSFNARVVNLWQAPSTRARRTGDYSTARTANKEGQVSSSIFVSALSTITRNKKHLIVALESSVQRRRSLPRGQRLQMVQLSRSRRPAYAGEGSAGVKGGRRRLRKDASTTMHAKDVFHRMNGKREEQQQQWLQCTRANEPNQDELEQGNAIELVPSLRTGTVGTAEIRTEVTL